MTVTEGSISDPGFEDINLGGQVDYFGADVRDKFIFPDGKTFIEFKKLMEGERKRYMDSTNREVAINRKTDDMKMKMNAGSDRWKLLELAVTDWNLVQRDPSSGNLLPVPYNITNLHKWLEVADPSIVDDLERAIRRTNPWLIGDVTQEDIDKGRADLDEQERLLHERLAGKAS